MKNLERYLSAFNRDQFRQLHEEMSFAEYIDRINENPKIVRNAFQYVYDMIMSHGSYTFERYRTTYRHYKFFDDPDTPIFGLEETLDAFVNFVHGAAGGYGTEHRILLLHGPVGSSKSTICRCLKRGLEKYSRTPEGAWYTFRWVNLPVEGVDALYTSSEADCPLNEDPIKLMPLEMRKLFLDDLNKTLVEKTPEEDKTSIYELISEGDLNPRCRLFMNTLLKKYEGDWLKVVTNHIRVIRKCHSESDRIGIGTFQPKDEKNQDATELTGDINFQKIGEFGSDSDSRAFNFDGEFQVANRGVCEFIEMLKLANEFLYDCLGVSAEHQIKPKKFSQIMVDEFVLGHSNAAEMEKLKTNRFMEALRDRMVKIDVPYLTRWSDEVKVYEQDYGVGKIKQHLMPHTIEICAFFAILTRLQDDKEVKLDLRDKAKLYDGRSLPGWTQDSVKELKDKYPTEGMKAGVSPRFIQDSLSNCLAQRKTYVNVFHAMNEIKARLYTSSMIDAELITRYEHCLDLSLKELQEILKQEVQKAMVADATVITRVCAKYIDNVVAYVNDEKVINQITNKPQEPDERLMRSVEEKIDIPEQGANDFRRSLAAFIGTLYARNKEFKWDSNPELARALEAKVFDDIKDTIKFSSLSSESAVCDKDLQEKIDAIKTRLIKQFGYNEESASDTLNYVASLFVN